MTRVFLLVGLLVSLPAYAQQIAIFPAGTTNHNAAKPLFQFAVQPTCGGPVAVENMGRTDRPDVFAWPQPSNHALDCSVRTASTPVATLAPLAPNGYQAALKLGSGAFGPLSNAFLAPALQSAVTVVAGQPFRVLMNHDGLFTTGYRLYIDNVKVGADLPLSALSNGVVTAPAPGVSVGNHTVELSAFGPAGEGPRSVALPFQGVAPLPSAGSNLRIVQP